MDEKIKQEFLEHIKKINTSNRLVIVEGKRDKKALENYH